MALAYRHRVGEEFSIGHWSRNKISTFDENGIIGLRHYFKHLLQVAVASATRIRQRRC